jgi:site-specific DNA recombinase
MNILKRIATYSRVSTSAQEDQQTIQTQLLTLKEFAEKNGYAIIQEYTDEGWSGDTIVRPALDQLRVDAKKKIWEAVLIYDPDRLARRYSYQELVMDELKEAGIEIIFVTISTPKNSEDKILYGVRGLFAEYERAKIAERFRLGKLRKIKEGHLIVSEALYGYSYIRKQDKIHGYYEINTEEARVVKMIFTMVADEKLTLRSVVKKLQALNIKPRKSKRGVWSTSTLTTLLRNKGYIGEAHWGSSTAIVPKNPTNKEKYRKNKKSSRKIRPESEWFIIPIPQLIDKELFFRAREQLEENFKLCQRNTKNEYLLSKKIYCPCGRRRTGEGPKQGKYLYYRCTDRVLCFPLPHTCKERGINARIADQMVWQKITELMTSRKLLLKQAERWRNTQSIKVTTSVDDIQAIEKEIAKLKYEEDRYNKAYGAELFTLEKLKEYTVPIRERISLLQAEVEKNKQQANQVNTIALPDKENINIFAERAANTLNNLNFATRRAIIVNVVEKIIGTEGKLLVYGNIAINENSHVAFSSYDRYGLNTTPLTIDPENAILIPFTFNIKLPPPLKRGINYGFKPLKLI